MVLISWVLDTVLLKNRPGSVFRRRRGGGGGGRGARQRSPSHRFFLFYVGSASVLATLGTESAFPGLVSTCRSSRPLSTVEFRRDGKTGGKSALSRCWDFLCSCGVLYLFRTSLAVDEVGSMAVLLTS